MRKVGLPARSFATWPLAQVPQVSGLFLLALPGYHAVPVAWPERERDTSATLGVSVALKERRAGSVQGKCTALSCKTLFWPSFALSLYHV